MIRSLILLMGCFLSTYAFANGLSGTWKIEGQPVWIEVQTENGAANGIVRRNDVNAGAEGRTLLKDVVADKDKSGLWRGQIYAARLSEYRDAEITLPDPSRMQVEVKVGFMSRAFVWQRVAGIPPRVP